MTDDASVPSDPAFALSTTESADDAAFAERLASLRPGVRFDGRFLVERVLGMGGMGCVIAAQHLELDERVAIKLLRPGPAPDPKRSQRLLREARAAAKIKSEHVVRVFDVVSEGQFAPYIVMEYLEGESLARRLRRERLDLEAAADYLIQACHALGEAHRFGIVHRDLKPANLFLQLRPRGRLKVLDFGIARSAAPGERITESHALLGSPGYAAPEQLQSAHSADPRSDVWSLGIVLFECLSGQLPFAGATWLEIFSQIMQGSPPSLSALRADVPPSVDGLIQRCLEKQPADRFASAAELVAALREYAPRRADECLDYLSSLPSAPAPDDRVRPAAVPQPEATLTAGGAELPAAPRRARRPGSAALRALMTTLVLALPLGVALFWLRGQRAAPPVQGDAQAIVTGSKAEPERISGEPTQPSAAPELNAAAKPVAPATETAVSEPRSRAVRAAASAPAPPTRRPAPAPIKPAASALPPRPALSAQASARPVVQPERPPWVEVR